MVMLSLPVVRHVKLNYDREGKIPKSFFKFALSNVKKELTLKRYGFKTDPYADLENIEDKQRLRVFRNQLKRLTLDTEKIVEREHERSQVDAPRAMMIVYHMICWTLDVIYADKPLDRFWMLETVARQPYFSYVAILHMYETLGWWEIDGNLKEEHAYEERNETMHLKIMESLGADGRWWNRFIARHGAIAYFMILIIFYLCSPRLAYVSSELLERHAVDTYDQFFEENETILKTMPLTEAAIEYMPTARNMYDVFRSISNDENHHADMMQYVKDLPT